MIGELAIFGVGLSMLAGYFAKACHAPNVRVMTEGGVYGATPIGGLPWGIECNRISANATSFTSALDALGFLVASGRCDVGIIGAAQLDKFGNVNTTGIWDGEIGRELPAAQDAAAGGWRRERHRLRRQAFPDHGRARAEEVCRKSDYISSPGYLEGGEARSRFGFPGGGPSAIITTLGILRPNARRKNSSWPRGFLSPALRRSRLIPAGI